TKNCRSKTKF
ncbi:Immunoglobulin A1 protease autotransporter precursor, partial [Haemophilus influenzae]